MLKKHEEVVPSILHRTWKISGIYRKYEIVCATESWVYRRMLPKCEQEPSVTYSHLISIFKFLMQIPSSKSKRILQTSHIRRPHSFIAIVRVTPNFDFCVSDDIRVWQSWHKENYWQMASAIVVPLLLIKRNRYSSFQFMNTEVNLQTNSTWTR